MNIVRRRNWGATRDVNSKNLILLVETVNAKSLLTSTQSLGRIMIGSLSKDEKKRKTESFKIDVSRSWKRAPKHVFLCMFLGFCANHSTTKIAHSSIVRNLPLCTVTWRSMEPCACQRFKVYYSSFNSSRITHKGSRRYTDDNVSFNSCSVFIHYSSHFFYSSVENSLLFRQFFHWPPRMTSAVWSLASLAIRNQRWIILSVLPRLN